MRRILRAIGLLALVAAIVVGCEARRDSGGAALGPRPGLALRLATHNVHYIRLGEASGRWSEGDWARRRGALDAAFKAVDADVMAFQEMESFGGGSEGGVNLALDWLLARNPGHAAAAVGEPSAFPSTQPILYRRDRLERLDQGWFFFSETPDAIYSRTFDGSYPAFASWAAFRDRASGAAFRVINVHFDYRSPTNRLRSAELVASRIAPWIAAGETVLLAGDLNAGAGAPTLRILERAGLAFAPVADSTFHFDRGLNLFGAIDHLASSAGAEPLGAPAVLRARFEGVWPSDHYPVAGDFRLE